MAVSYGLTNYSSVCDYGIHKYTITRVTTRAGLPGRLVNEHVTCFTVSSLQSHTIFALIVKAF